MAVVGGRCSIEGGVSATADDEAGGRCDEAGGSGCWREGGCAARAAFLPSGAVLLATVAFHACRTRAPAEMVAGLSLCAALLRRPRRGRQDWCRLGSGCSSTPAVFTCPAAPPTR